MGIVAAEISHCRYRFSLEFQLPLSIADTDFGLETNYPVLLFLGAFVPWWEYPWCFDCFCLSYSVFKGSHGEKSLMFLRFPLVFSKRIRKRRPGQFQFRYRLRARNKLILESFLATTVLQLLNMSHNMLSERGLQSVVTPLPAHRRAKAHWQSGRTHYAFQTWGWTLVVR